MLGTIDFDLSTHLLLSNSNLSTQNFEQRSYINLENNLFNTEDNNESYLWYSWPMKDV